MSQPRIFVTYIPAPPVTKSGDGPARGRARGQVAAVVAGALLTGGGLHGLGNEEVVRPAAASPGAAVPLPRQGPPVSASSLALLAVAQPVTSPRGALPTSPTLTVGASAKIAAPRAARRPRVHLAGFLEDRGVTLDEAVAPVKMGEAISEAGNSPSLTELSPIAVVPSAATPRDDVAPAAASRVSMLEQTYPMVEVGGREIGAVVMRGEAIHLRSLVGLLELRLPGSDLDNLKSAPAADSFVTLEALRAIGIAATIDAAGGRVSLSVPRGQNEP